MYSAKFFLFIVILGSLQFANCSETNKKSDVIYESLASVKDGLANHQNLHLSTRDLVGLLCKSLEKLCGSVGCSKNNANKISPINMKPKVAHEFNNQGKPLHEAVSILENAIAEYPLEVTEARLDLCILCDVAATVCDFISL